MSKVGNRDELSVCLVVTHDVASAVSFSDTIWLMGRDDGKSKARIVDVIDLVAEGLCWHEDIHRTPEFTAMVAGLEDRFSTL